MERDRGFRSLVVIALVVAIAGISVAFAALSQTLTVSGTGTVKGGTWSVKFANLQDPTIIGQAVIDTPAKLENNATTLEFAISLKQPGDSVTYLFNVINDGSIAAKVTAVNLTGVTEANAANVTYTLTHADGSQILVGETLAATSGVQPMKLVVTFKDTATEIPQNDVPLSLGATITYTQQ